MHDTVTKILALADEYALRCRTKVTLVWMSGLRQGMQSKECWGD